MALPHKNKSSSAATGLVVLLLAALLVATPEALLRCPDDGSGGSLCAHATDILQCTGICVSSGATGSSCSEAADGSIRCRCCIL